MPSLSLALILAMTHAPTYVALGDSTGVGVGARRGGGYPARLVERLARDGVPLRLVNLCVSGARVADVLEAQLERGVAAGPGVVTLGIGINDVTHGTDLAAFADDYERLAAALAGTGAAVVLVNVPDLSLSPLAQGEDTKRLVRRRIALVNGVITAAARRHRFTLVDLFSATEDALAQHADALFSEDRFHPSDEGYERWADVMAPALRRAATGGDPALPAGASPR